MDYSRITSTWWSGTCYHKEQLQAIITSSDIHRYAYILHDKDKQPNSEELKKPHYHFVVQFAKNQRGSWFKAFATDDMGLVFVQRCSIPESAYNYLIHDTPSCRKEGKHLYDVSERISTIETFDEPAEKDEDEHTVLYNDILELVNKQISWGEFIKRKPKRIHMIGNIKTAHDLLIRENKFDNNFRKLDVTYIYGQTAKGKTRSIMERYGYKNVYRVTKYDHTAFDQYIGQDVVVFEEFRSSFKIEDMLNYLDGYPLMLPSRYNDKEACYTKVYIVTNWVLEQQYKNVQTEHPTTWQAFNRRIHKVFNFDRNPELNLKEKYEQTSLQATQLQQQRKSKLTPIDDDGELPF
ncbi:MAG: Rep family protein [Firmicutes bacterium]|nr:Rep family protein [Bacillota bacterium]